MFAPSVIAARLDALCRAHRVSEIRESSVAEIEEWTARLESAINDKGELTRELSPEEKAFILNERILGTASFEYWCSRYAFCSVEGAGIKRMYPLFDSQHLILKELARLEEDVADANRGILANILKARRLGASTFAEAAGCHRLTTQSYLYGVVASEVPSQSSYTIGILHLIYMHLPWWLKPGLVSYSNTYPEEYVYSNGSQVWSHAGQSTRGVSGDRGQIGRGKGVSFVHLTELSVWEDTRQIDSALLPTMPYSPRLLALFESSPRGRNNWWHEHWLSSLEGHGDFAPIFIPWYAEPKKYRRPAPPGWSPSEATIVHARRCEEQGPRWLHRSVSLTRDQLYWYERTRAYYVRKGELSDFLQEYAADPEECFVFSGRTLVPLDVLQRVTDQARPLAGAYEIVPMGELQKAGLLS